MLWRLKPKLKLIPKILSNKKSIRTSKKFSIIKDIFRKASLLQFNELVKITRPQHNPCWFLDYTSCDISLPKYVKQNTWNEVFKTYRKREEYYIQKHWKLLQMVQSMYGITSYAITLWAKFCNKWFFLNIHLCSLLKRQQ